MTSKINYLHHTPIQIRFNDIDILGHVNNSVYQNYFDLARTHYFQKIFPETINWKEYTLVLAKLCIEFLQPVTMEEAIQVETKIIKMGNKSMTMKQRVVDRKGEVRAINEGVLVSFHAGEEQPVPIPEKWRKAIAGFEKDIDFSTDQTNRRE